MNRITRVCKSQPLLIHLFFSGYLLLVSGPARADPVDLSLGNALPNTTTPTTSERLPILPRPQLNICEGLITHKERLRVKPVALPPYLKRYKEPGFDTTVMRITDSVAGSVIKPAGNPAQAWNSNEQYLMLQQRKTSGEWRKLILDGINYELIGDLQLPDHEGEDVFWSHKHPQIVFYTTNNGSDSGRLIEHNIETNQKKILVDFSPFCIRNSYSAENGLLAKPSYDDNVFGYRCGLRPDRNLNLTYDRTTNSVTSREIRADSPEYSMKPPQPLPTGDRFILNHTLFDKHLDNSIGALDISTNQTVSSVALKRNGDLSLFNSSNSQSPQGCNGDIWKGIGLLVEHNLQDLGCKTRLTQTDRFPKTPAGTEMFASAYSEPGWLAMSSKGYESLSWFTNNRLAPLLFSEIYLVNTEKEDKESVCRLAHHRSFGEYAQNANYPKHLSNANVTQSPSGTRLLFSSDWYDSGAVNTFVIETSKFSYVNLDGSWVDKDNHTMYTTFIQHGNRVSFRRQLAESNSPDDLVTTGLGEIKGRKIYIDYIAHVSDVRKVAGSCYSQIKENEDHILFECKDTYFGSQWFTLVKPTQ